MSIPQYTKRRDPRITVGAIVAVIIIAVAGFAIWSWPKHKMYVYTYDSFMAWGDDPSTIDERVFGQFELTHGVDIEIVRLQTDASGIVARLNAEASKPVADVVIGIDNVLVMQEAARAVLEPYNATGVELIDTRLVNALSPDHYLTPFDFGIIAVVYSLADMNTTTHPVLANLTFEALAAPDMASALVTENPHLSSPGLAFMLSQIAAYEKILGKDWTEWWTQVKSKIDVQQGWSEAWSKWDDDPTRHMLVSYGTDPAYSAYYTGSAPNIGVAPFVYNNSSYAWLQVEGVGVVKNGPNPGLARAFVDYCLTLPVQQQIALNQWMFPVSPGVTLPEAFQYALHPEDVTDLNQYLSATEIRANLTQWLDEWDIIMTQ
ncbi:MAG: thiamine ABC transporter substrate-binding protein [Candidatus Thorarchaeota archaeon]|nr:thiamine ABC transporter substrate-binding protein [Candidatus Thorarchaeota archaeon]